MFKLRVSTKFPATLPRVIPAKAVIHHTKCSCELHNSFFTQHHNLKNLTSLQWSRQAGQAVHSSYLLLSTCLFVLSGFAIPELYTKTLRSHSIPLYNLLLCYFTFQTANTPLSSEAFTSLALTCITPSTFHPVSLPTSPKSSLQQQVLSGVQTSSFLPSTQRPPSGSFTHSCLVYNI